MKKFSFFFAILRAKWILFCYGHSLAPKWKGNALVWHVWHSPSKLWSITYVDYVYRIIEIEKNKPAHEIPLRFNLLKPVESPVLKKLFPIADGLNRTWSETQLNVVTEQKYLTEILKAEKEELPQYTWSYSGQEIVFPL